MSSLLRNVDYADNICSLDHRVIGIGQRAADVEKKVNKIALQQDQVLSLMVYRILAFASHSMDALGLVSFDALVVLYPLSPFCSKIRNAAISRLILSRGSSASMFPLFCYIT